MRFLKNHYLMKYLKYAAQYGKKLASLMQGSLVALKKVELHVNFLMRMKTFAYPYFHILQLRFKLFSIRVYKAPLTVLVMERDVHAIQALLKNGKVDINAKSYIGYTALHWAVRLGFVEIVRILIAAGADINVPNKEGETAIVLAFKSDRFDIMHLLQNQGAQLPEELQQQRQEINSPQSVHEISVHISVSRSAKALKLFYGNYLSLDTVQEAIHHWANGLTGTDIKTQAAKRAIERLQNVHFVDARSGVTLKEALAFVWLGVNDINAQNDLKLNHEDIKLRREKFIHDLYEIQRTENIDDRGQDDGKEDDITCLSGSFNKLIMGLNGGHSCVDIRFVNATSIYIKGAALLNQAFQQLDHDQQRSFANNWENDSDLFYNQVKSSISNHLHQEFDEFADDVNNYELIIPDFINNLQWVSLPALQTLQESLANEKVRDKPITSLLPLQLAASSNAAVLPQVEMQRTALISRPK